MIFVTRERPLPHVFCYPSERTGTIDAEAAEHGNAQGIDRGCWQALSHQQSPAEAADPGGIYAGHRVHRKHAIRVLNGEVTTSPQKRKRDRIYDEAVHQA